MERSIQSLRLTVILGIICSALGSSFIWLGLAPMQVIAVGASYRLPLVIGGKVSVAPGIDDRKISLAVRTKPIDQAIVNAAMVTSMAQRPSMDLAPWLDVVASLGWRNTTSQQNIIAAAIQRNDVASIINSADALLRIGTLFDEAARFMNLAEAYPETWPRVLSLLKSNVSWRHAYLGQASPSMLPVVLDGRIRTIVALKSTGDRLDRQQVRPLVAALATAGRLSEANRIWRDYTGDQENALYDMRFERALAQIDQPLTPLSFDWTLNLGEGYAADIAPNGLGGSVVNMRWDGRGVPVFFSQQASIRPGYQLLRVSVDGDVASFGERVGFRLRCSDSIVEFDLGRRLDNSELTLMTVQPVTCWYPVLEAYGRVEKTERSFDGALTAISMRSANQVIPALQKPQ